ncbi:hypothetical protein [Azotosporobacter soli]|uniref:hypothetical protein n=1 Tax=Azotosporobacter soli TaxID=3055040 RepID=UPI0031FEBF52
MLEVFKAVEKKRKELEELRIIIQATGITYRQRGERSIAEHVEKLEEQVEKAVQILRMEA